jgi:serine/threonine-protein kinase
MTPLKDTVLKKQYFLRELAGSGGMAVVYKAWDQSRMATLAIKVLNPSLAGDYAFLDHFREEARALARLQHPNIVRFYSLERDGDTAFIVMDYIEGVTLREEMNAGGGQLPPQRILEIMRGICAALNYAHELGYIHCDIKPANILINKNGTALVADFGIARLAGGASAVTARGGTPGYMSPEQIRGAPPTRASDIYALGVLLFELLSGGKRPFNGQAAQIAGNTAERIRWEQTHLSPPSPRQYNPSISPDLEAVILQCLEMEASRRFSSAQALLAALEQPLIALSQKAENSSRFAEQAEVPARSVNAREPQSRKSKHILLWPVVSGVVIILFVLILGGGRLPLSPGSSEPNPPPFSVRTYNALLDSDKQRVWYRTSIEWPTQPGHYYWDVEFPANTPLLLYMGWCAIDQETLDANWLLMDYKISIDGYEISDSYLSNFPTRSGDLFCYGKKGILEGWSKGKHTYIEIQHIEKTLFDGTDTYAAGDYTFEFTVNVK